MKTHSIGLLTNQGFMRWTFERSGEPETVTIFFAARKQPSQIGTCVSGNGKSALGGFQIIDSTKRRVWVFRDPPKSCSWYFFLKTIPTCNTQSEVTPWKFNIAPEKSPSQEERLVFQPSFFRGENVKLLGV